MSRSPSAGADLAPEVWRLVHPDRGTLAVAVGTADELRTLDPDYPVRKKSKNNDNDDNNNDDNDDDDEATRSESDASADVGSKGGDAKADGEKDPAEASPGFVLLRDGALVARAREIGDHKVSLEAEPPGSGKFTSGLSAFSGPLVQMRSSAFSTAVRQVTFRDGKEVVHFDPPPGSAAEARLDAIAASPWKRVVYPLAAGVGKSGWAIAMILLLPLLGRLLERIFDWIAERVPDIEIPWPDVTLPSIPWPDISVPSVNLPEVSLPGWAEFLLEYSKVWIPLLIGVALGVLAVRHSRRSRRIKRKWEAEQRREDRPHEA